MSPCKWEIIGAIKCRKNEQFPKPQKIETTSLETKTLPHET